MKSKFTRIAVVSMAGVFPQAHGTRQFFQNILDKKESIIQVPEDRWLAPPHVMVSSQAGPDRAVSDRAGLITDFQFNPQGFKVESSLLRSLDQVHHLVLEAGQKAADKCYLSQDIKKRTGVVLAAIALPTDLSTAISRQILYGKGNPPICGADLTRASMVSAPAAVLARAMGFGGGSFTLDAACASSLYAIKLACEHLHLGKADTMIAGGVSSPDSLYTQVGFTQLKALSPTGRCSPFDKSANGLVVGEGAGIIVLKRLEDALACGDTIHAVITGAGASNDIEGNLVAPASEGQVRAMKNAYEQAGMSPADIQYMECHGSGTPVGDQVEVSSIKALMDHYCCPEKVLSIGSVKSNTGHLLTAAGAAGFIKTVMAMEKGVLPPSLNFASPPEKSLLNQTGIKVQTEAEPWDASGPGIPRKAGISAFGFGGINGHLLVEEYKPEPSRHFVPGPARPPVPCAVVGMATLSGTAEDLDQLREILFGLSFPGPGSSKKRWPESIRDDQELTTAFMDEISITLGEFKIPPVQMEDILPQHLAMLKTAKKALKDAGITPRPGKTSPPRYTMGCAMGIDFDFGAADFSLRWKHHDLDKKLLDKITPPLTFDRTLGALGGIVASRVAREFKLGGPCFTLSAGSASGIKALETGIHSLTSGETDLFLCGCVDLSGDLRSFTLKKAGLTESPPPLLSEGAAAMVLKPLDQALADKDRIYGVITGVGGSGGAPFSGDDKTCTQSLEKVYKTSLEMALAQSAIPFSDLSMITSHACRDRGIKPHGYHAMAEARVVETMSANPKQPNINCPAFLTGDTGAAASLFSVIATCLALHHRTLPLAVPDRACQPWQTEHGKKRKALVASITEDGACAHLTMEEADMAGPAPTALPGLPPEHQNKSARVFNIPLARPRLNQDLIALLQKNEHPHGRQTFSGTEPASKRRIIKESFNNTPDIREPYIDGPSTDQGIPLLAKTQGITTQAHEKFLELSAGNMEAMAEQLTAIARAVPGADPESEAEFRPKSGLSSGPGTDPDSDPVPTHTKLDTQKTPEAQVFLGRDKCLEYAVGKAGNVLGPEFDIIDTYPVRVRLPDEPLMLVDRIMDIQGEMLSLTSGKIVTQHDVKHGAWYLDGGRAPVSISIEAGQADLFLCAWLGIDHVVKGSRKYRLLDAKVTFHRELPVPGETIEYHIEIDRFLKQGDIYLFFFHYKGYIGDRLFISMRDGCAGFFTEDEVINSGGIILKKEEKEKLPTKTHVRPFVPIEKTSLSDDQVLALRKGDLERAFGKAFAGITPGKNQWLPGGRMALIDRVLDLDPSGGRFGLGKITAEADIHPDAWFLTCHFIDDMVMPGTLMYECCAHTLRVFLQRMGWLTQDGDAHLQILAGNESDLKCRGPVTQMTKKVRYEIEIKEMGYNPEPYIIADAHMFSDDLRIVLYKDMGMRLAGTTQQDLSNFWSNR